ncbi:MAG: hypothetical protein HKN00_12535 [Flavobacteriaceae bacterium]|nr:hypothetical protein [Flavobacteriaceae bacterium]
MKIKLKYIILSLSCISLAFGQQSDITIIDPVKPSGSIPIPAERYEDSVIFVQNLDNLNSKSNSGKQVITIEIINFDSRYKLLPAYLINGIEYCDNGEYNDEIAGDGIFSSVNKYEITLEKSSNGIEFIQGPKFKYNSEMQAYIASKYGGTKDTGIKFGCKMRTIPCPNTNWWNSCWPLSSPCTCIEFYDCEFEIELKF